jgi:hypothetical protein
MTKVSKISENLADVLSPVNAVNGNSLFKNEGITLPKGFDNAIISGNKVYGFVSQNFGLIKPMDVMETFGNEFEKYGIPFETKGKIDSKGNYELRFEFTNDKLTSETWSVNDELKAMLAFGGGLAGTRSTYLNDMVTRLACLNGMTRIHSQILMNKVRNTKNTHATKFGIDFELLMPLVETFINSHDYIKEQKILIDMELKNDHILPFFYEITKGTKFPESKFQDAYDRMKLEATNIGFTAMNRYLAYAGLNYILEHDSMAMDLVQTKNTDNVLASKVENLSIGNAVKNFNQIVRSENERIETYKSLNDGKEPRGKRKVLELV